MDVVANVVAIIVIADALVVIRDIESYGMVGERYALAPICGLIGPIGAKPAGGIAGLVGGVLPELPEVPFFTARSAKTLK